jgi:hypothetical protein
VEGNAGLYSEYNYSIFDRSGLFNDIDVATRTCSADGCGSSSNCSDYWYKFTVPNDATGIKIEGNDEYGSLSVNNSTQVVGVYRAPLGCNGSLNRLNCDAGGLTTDVEFDIAVSPGEVLYLQVFDDASPTPINFTKFGLCISKYCGPKNTCTTSPNLNYGCSTMLE